jgi:hypothetical protein
MGQRFSARFWSVIGELGIETVIAQLGGGFRMHAEQLLDVIFRDFLERIVLRSSPCRHGGKKKTDCQGSQLDCKSRSDILQNMILRDNSLSDS